MRATPPLPADLEAIPRSGIRVLMDRAWEIGEPITHLEVGEPGFSTPDHIVEAFCHAARAGATRYVANAGIAPLREACARKLSDVNGIEVAPDQIVATVGAMHGLMSAVVGLTRTGDEILTPRPGWPNYLSLIALAGCRAVPYDLRTDAGGAPDPVQLESLVTPRTKMIIVNSPSNPLGTILGPEELDAIHDLARRHGLWVLSDECYDQIVFDDEMVSAAARPGGAEHTITVHSFSKTYAMTGFRLGYVSAPPRVAALLTKLQESMIACVNTPTQHAGVAAIEGPQDELQAMVSEYRARRDLGFETARDLDLRPRRPTGAFYLWLEADGIGDSSAFAERLLTTHRVAVAPGSTFGEQRAPALRISLAAPRAAITAGLAAIRAQLDDDEVAREE